MSYYQVTVIQVTDVEAENETEAVEKAHIDIAEGTAHTKNTKTQKYDREN